MARFPLQLLLLAAIAVAALSVDATTKRVPRAEAAGVVLDELASGFSQPLGIVDAGDGSGRLFVLQKGGLIRIFDGTSVLPAPFLDVSSLITNPAASEQGLLGLAFHPDYESNGLFYVNYTDANGDTRIVRYHVSVNPNVADAGSASQVVFVDQTNVNHNGGQLQFGPDGYLYIGLGDGGGIGDPDAHGQNLETLLGKILRIDVDSGSPYVVPPDNPLVGVAGLDEIWAYGLRNPWRFSFDRLTGDLFVADVGQSNYEEVDFQPAGATSLVNYGWRVMEGAHCYDPPTACDTSGKTLPIIEYDHGLGCSVTGGFRYRGGDASLYGKYVYGDFCSGRIWTATENGGVWTPALALDTTLLISSFGEDADGELYAAGYGDGKLYQITGVADGDDDGVSDTIDNCPSDANPGQENADGLIDLSPPKPYDDITLVTSDEAGDACDADDDNDGLTDVQETSGAACGGAVTGALTRDSDGDLNLDGAECALGTNPNSTASKPPSTSCGALADADDDGLSARAEFCFHASSDASADTDGDGCDDSREVASVNSDRTVSSIDLSQIAQSFAAAGYTLPASALNADFDVNKDGKISAIDLSQVAQRFGMC
jgi:glucose/arabinose dehydrogenase